MLATTKFAFLFYLSLSTLAQQFTLQQSYTGLDFFDRDFTFYSGYDPTFGYVHYVDLATAEQHGMVDLINVTNTGIARWGVETVGRFVKEYEDSLSKAVADHASR